MDKHNVFLRNGRNVFRVTTLTNLEITTLKIHKNYTLYYNSAVMSETGLLTVFSLKASDRELPCYQGRFDESKEALDIDMKYDDKDIRNKFYKSSREYLGHKTIRRPTSEKRLFDVDIRFGKEIIFEGVVAFNINHSENLFS